MLTYLINIRTTDAYGPPMHTDCLVMRTASPHLVRASRPEASDAFDDGFPLSVGVEE